MHTFPDTATTQQRAFVEHLTESVKQDGRFLGLSLSGSYSENRLDKYSDLDVVLAVRPEHLDEVMLQRQSFASALGPLVASFTGEHVGEPRLLICLYEGEPPLHVDLKFVAPDEVAERVDQPTVVWEIDQSMSQCYASGDAHYPLPTLQWFEDRIWIWLHYGTAKVARGELFEAMEFLSYLRQSTLGPLALFVHGFEPSGVRKIEQKIPAFAQQLQSTLADYNQVSLFAALEQVCLLYRSLRDQYRKPDDFVVRHQAEHLAMKYLGAEKRSVERRQ